jgi:hypothetical protein
MRAEERCEGRWWLSAAGLALAVAITVGMVLSCFAEPVETTPDAAARDPDYMAGKQALERKDWAEAVQRFSQAALRDPDNADLHNYLS